MKVTSVMLRQEASRHFWNTKREYLKEKINELKSNSNDENIREVYRGINKFKKCYQPRTNFVKNERGDLNVGPHKINR
jgi:hypothetical protein